MNTHAIRPAQTDDVPALEALIRDSVWQLQAKEYSEAQRLGALGTVFGIDTQLIEDQTYYLLEIAGELAACGGWSYRSTLFGADAHKTGPATRLNPQTDAARIRAFFVAPSHARQGLGSVILSHCEKQARERGFSHFELGATLSGQPFYSRHGYRALERVEVPLANAQTLPIIRMHKP